MSPRLAGVPGAEAAVSDKPERGRGIAGLTTESLLAHVGAIVASCKALALFVRMPWAFRCRKPIFRREGRPVGAMFLVGDAKRVRFRILSGGTYNPQERNELDYSLEKTTKEITTIDRAFVIRGDGVFETYGAHIWAAIYETVDLPRGLGA